MRVSAVHAVTTRLPTVHSETYTVCMCVCVFRCLLPSRVQKNDLKFTDTPKQHLTCFLLPTAPPPPPSPSSIFIIPLTVLDAYLSRDAILPNDSALQHVHASIIPLFIFAISISTTLLTLYKSLSLLLPPRPRLSISNAPLCPPPLRAHHPARADHLATRYSSS